MDVLVDGQEYRVVVATSSPNGYVELQLAKHGEDSPSTNIKVPEWWYGSEKSYIYCFGKLIERA